MGRKRDKAVNCRQMLWMSLWVTEPNLWIEAHCCGQVAPRLTCPTRRNDRRTTDGRHPDDTRTTGRRAVGRQTATISTGMPLSTEVPDNGSIAS